MGISNSPQHSGLIDNIKSCDWSSVINELTNIPKDEASSQLSTFITVLSKTGRIIKYSILHYICEYNPPLNVIKLLLSIYPASLLRKSSPGDLLPMHISSTFCSPTVTMYLLSRAPKTMHCKDELGNLPIHLLCYSSTQFYSSNTTNNFGSTPIDIISRLSYQQYPNKQGLIDLLQRR